MFRRDARNKLRNMGGIMASSEPLIQEVAKYQFGGNVDILSEIQRMRPDIRSAFIRSLGNPPKRTGVRSQTIFSDQDPIYSSLVNGRELNLPRVRPGDPGSPQFRGGILAGEAQNTVERQQLNKIINNANQLGLLEAPTLNKTDLENFIKNQTGDDGFKLTSELWNSLSEDKSPSMSNLEKVAKEIFKYTSTPSVAAIDLMGGAINYLRQMPSGTADKILSGQMKLPTGVDFVSLALASGKNLEELEALGVPATQMAAIKEARDKGLGIETKVKIKDDVAEKEALEAEQIAVREAEKKKAVEGGMPLSNQVGTTDVKALQDQLSGGRISSEAPQTLGVTADQGTEYEHKVATDKFREDGNLDNIKDTVQNTVKSGVGTGGALKQLINEFTSNAPEYEGMDRGLAIAKIGFAMAAGQSPNAITNIANALSQGADMFLKDDEKRRDFKRQVELAGLQYGIGELSKIRSEGRALARQDRNLKYFVAGKDMKVNGVAYEEGSVVPISEGYIRQNGIPSGLTTENLVKGAQSLQAKLEKILAEQNEKKIMTDKDYRANREVISNAASKFEESRNLMTLVEGSIYKVVGGEVTGLAPAAKNIIDKAFSAAFNGKGVSRDKTYRSVAEYNRDMQEVANKLIKEIIQEGGKNISNVDRQLAQEIVGLYTGYGGYIFQNENVLLGRLQSIHKTLQKTQQKSIADMTDMLNLSIGRTFQSGAPVTYSRVGETALGAIGQQGGGTKDIFLRDLLTDGQVDADKVTNIFGIS